MTLASARRAATQANNQAAKSNNDPLLIAKARKAFERYQALVNSALAVTK